LKLRSPFVFAFVALTLVACNKRKSEVRALEERDGRSKRVTCTLPEGDGITTVVTVPERCELRVDKTIVVKPEGTLRIEAGARVLFAKGTSLRVEGGTFSAVGSERDPVVLTSASEKPQPGDWGGIVLDEPVRIPTAPDAAALTYAPVLDRVIVEYAGGEAPQVEAAITVRGPSQAVTLAHANVRRNLRAGVRMHSNLSRFVRFEANVFESNDGTSLDVPADSLGSIANGTFAEPIRTGGQIFNSQTWPKLPVPIVVRDAVMLLAAPSGKPVVLTIAEGSVIAFRKAKGITMGFWPGGTGSIVARKVRFTSAEEKPAPGDWNGIHFGSHAGASVIDDCVFEYAGHSLPDHGTIELPTDDKKIVVTHTTFRNGLGPAIIATDCKLWDVPAKGNTSIGKPLCEENMAIAILSALGSGGSASSTLSVLGSGKLESIGSLSDPMFPGPMPTAKPVQSVTDSEPSVKGTLSSEVVRRVVKTSFSRLRFCFDTALEKNASLSGSVTVDFTIDSKGAVSTASASGGTLGDASAKSCIAGVYRSLSFPAPESGVVTVTHTTSYSK